MSIVVRFNPASLTTEKYDEAIRRLQAAGAGPPPGRSYHCAFSGRGGLHVFDVWDSREDFEKFGETLMPILTELGVDPGEPVVAEVHNIITG